jgi:TolA-binding protein
VVVERGSLHVDIVPRKGNEWSVIGGPFEIHVTGTVFDAAWDPEREELSVAMQHGQVIVHGPCAAAERTLSGREAAKISCAPAAEKEPGATSSEPTPAAPPAPALPGAPAPAGAASSSAASAPRAVRSANVPPATPPASWKELVGEGRYQAALVAAETAGFDRLCNELGPHDLLELGAAARMAGRSARATEAYAAARRRFPGSDSAATAAFHLGQLAFDGARAFAEAHGWFETYLAERPQGALAAEALGRAMEAEQRMGDPSARATAEKYLARFPDGAHAALAKRLLAR